MTKTIVKTPRQGVLQFGDFSMTATGLAVKGRPSFDEWKRCGVWLQQVEGAVQFWIGDWINYGEIRYRGKYAEAINESQALVWKNYAWVSRHVEMSLRNDKVGWSHHYEVAKFHDEPKLQRELLAAAEGLTISEFKALIRARLHGDKVAAIAAGAFPTGEYDIVCADPPWSYSNTGFEQSAAEHYPTMAVEDIATLPQTDATFPRFADPCVLFLWATSPLVPEATVVMQAWGFVYKACLVWVKDRAPGLGWWLNTRHELLLVGARGSSLPVEKVDSVIEGGR